MITNVKWQLEKLKNDDLIKSHSDAGKLLVVGAFYELSSCIVDFL